MKVDKHGGLVEVAATTDEQEEGRGCARATARLDRPKGESPRHPTELCLLAGLAPPPGPFIRASH